MIEQPIVLAPLGADLDAQVEEDARVEKPLQLVARRSTDGLDHLATPADDDRLLRLALDQDRAIQAQQPTLIRFFEAIDDHRRRKRQLRMGVLQHLFADN